MCKNPTIPRGTDSTNVLQDGPLHAQPSRPVLPHSRRPGNDFVRDQLGHGNITDLTRTEALGAVAAHPGSVLLEGAAVTAEDQTRFHLTTELAVTKQSLASFVEQEIKISLAGQLSLSTTIWNTFGDADAGTRGSNSGEPSATSCSTCRY